jgi:polyisoprenoid-binding protein YceI
MTRAACLLVALLAALAVAAVDPAQSRVGFVFKQMNVPVEGSFKRFTADIHFDAQRPEASRAEIDIDLRSIDTGIREADDEAMSRDWFDTAAHPSARFVSTQVRRPGPDRFEVTGKLSIKGRARDITVPVQVQRLGTALSYEGRFTIKRLDFAVGEGVWTDTTTVADEVEVRFRMVQPSDARSRP